MVIARMPEDRSKTRIEIFKDLKAPSQPCTPVCVHLYGPLTIFSDPLDLSRCRCEFVDVDADLSTAMQILSPYPPYPPIPL
eukprot:16044192-Heterocapsa_arctica.AAC.1